MTLRAPVAVELGWFIVTNSAELPIAPDESSAGIASRSAGTPVAGARDRPHDLEGLVGDWAAQTDLVVIVGLLLRGWRKGRDTEAGATLGRASPPLTTSRGGAARAVDAAERRLSAASAERQAGAARSRRGNTTSAGDDRDGDDGAEDHEVAGLRQARQDRPSAST